MQMTRSARIVFGVATIVVLFLTLAVFWTQYRDGVSRIRRQGEAALGRATGSTGAASAESSQAATTSKAAGSSGPKKYVVVLIQGLNFRDTPASDANPIRGLEEGEKLLYLGTEGNRYRVKDASGVTGYVTKSDQYVKIETVK